MKCAYCDPKQNPAQNPQGVCDYCYGRKFINESWVKLHDQSAFSFDSTMIVPLKPVILSLSRLCRFGGQVSHFYTVAQHSIHVAHLCPPECRLEGLLHDFPEGMGLGDIPNPLKSWLRGRGGVDSIGIFERRMNAILEKQIPGLDFNKHGDAVHEADLAACALEAEYLMGGCLTWEMAKKVNWEKARALPETLHRYYWHWPEAGTIEDIRHWTARWFQMELPPRIIEGALLGELKEALYARFGKSSCEGFDV